MAENVEANAKEIERLESELRDKSLALANLEVMIEDYRRERSKLLEELMWLREKLWDLSGEREDSNDRSEMRAE
jgi:septal ring factor EnvC (AmiA/AmiB activator)